MKKKLVAIITVLVMASMSLCACGSPSPSDVVDSFMTALKAQDAESITGTYAGGDFDLTSDIVSHEGETEEESIDTLLLDKVLGFDYVIGEETIDGDKATVTVEITTYDIGTGLKAFFVAYLNQALPLALGGASDAELEELGVTLFKAEMDKLTEKEYTGTVTLSLTNTDEGWVIDEIAEDDEFYNVLTGGGVEAMNEIESSF